MNRNLRVLATGVLGMYYIYIVEEPGFDGELTDDNLITFSKRGINVPES